jgi:hypothetical protein
LCIVCIQSGGEGENFEENEKKTETTKAKNKNQASLLD